MQKDTLGQWKVGKGSVFIVEDSWLYNEYTDGRKNPIIYQNFSSAKGLVKLALGTK